MGFNSGFKGLTKPPVGSQIHRIGRFHRVMDIMFTLTGKLCAAMYGKGSVLHEIFLFFF